jgi:putative addiction module killer protein
VLELRQTRVFEKWFARLRDARARARILTRLDLARRRHFGDCRSAGEAVLEMRIDFGPGYRVYFLSDSAVLILLCGGDKSTQERDIERAKSLAREQREGTL